jgi:hypothetical protein
MGRRLDVVKANPNGRPKGAARALGPSPRLTLQQIEFAKLVAGGTCASLAEAYRIAYNADKATLKTQREEASKLAKSPNVAAYIERLKQEDTGLNLRDASAIRQFVLRGLAGLAANSRSDMVRTRCYELLGRTGEVGLFVERSEVVHRDDRGADVRVELAQRLRALLGPPPGDDVEVIDVTPVLHEDSPALPAPVLAIGSGEDASIGHTNDADQPGGDLEAESLQSPGAGDPHPAGGGDPL